MINAIPSATDLTPQGNQTSSSPGSTGLTSDFQTFLKMLTAQARYQDPLEPIDSTEYASQLAQFSMVEQQVKTNDGLAAIFGQMSSSNMASLANWVGMEVRAPVGAYFDGSPITISPTPAPGADRAELVVFDDAGTEVQRSKIPVATEAIEWAGVGGDGPFPRGVYEFKVESYSGDTLILSNQAETYGKVTEAQIQNGEIALILEGAQAIPSSSVTGLREAP